MLPIRLETQRFVGGFAFGLADAPGALVADPLQREPLIFEQLDLEDALFLRFANCRSDEDFVRFLDRFGDESVWAVDELRQRAAAMTFNAMAAIGAVVDKVSKTPRDPHWVNVLLQTASIRPQMRRIDGAARLVLVVGSTLDFMALEIAAALEVGARMTSCRHCRKHFLFGPFTGRRSHGKYCSDRCRAAATRARNTKQGDDQ